MIIKTVGIASGDGPRITGYAIRQGDNELVEVLQNDNHLLMVKDDFAAAKGRKNGLLHTIISPDQPMTDAELKQTIAAINEEFGYNENDPFTLTAHQQADADGVTRKHWHLVRPSINGETGKTYKMFRSKAKDEAVSRLMELTLGHKLTSGPNNAFAEKRLREQGRDELADRLAAELNGERPRAAFSSDQHQQAKRAGFDLPALRHQLTQLAELPSDQQAQALAQLMHDQGLELTPDANGRKTRIWLKLPGGLSPLDANRTLKIRKAAPVANFITETKEHLNELKSDKPDLEIRSVHRSDDDADRRAETDTRELEESSPGSRRDNPAEQHRDRDLSVSDQWQNEEINDGSSSINNSQSEDLTAAAAKLWPEIQSFQKAVLRAGDLESTDLDPIPDIRDPNLLRKLSAMLAKAMKKSVEAAKRGLPRECS